MDELRFNLVRLLAIEATGPMATEAEFCAAYAAACENLRSLGWAEL